MEPTRGTTATRSRPEPPAPGAGTGTAGARAARRLIAVLGLLALVPVALAVAGRLGAGEPVVLALPAANAVLNGTSAVLLAAGLAFVRRRRLEDHRACMAAAVVVSALFLLSYLVYHAHVGSRPFQGQGWIRPVYFAVLLSHTGLAVAIVPLVLLTLGRALRGRFDRHAAVARWTLPLWLYVSVTGVAIYLMLYRLWP